MPRVNEPLENKEETKEPEKVQIVTESQLINIKLDEILRILQVK